MTAPNVMPGPHLFPGAKVKVVPLGLRGFIEGWFFDRASTVWIDVRTVDSNGHASSHYYLAHDLEVIP